MLVLGGNYVGFFLSLPGSSEHIKLQNIGIL